MQAAWGRALEKFSRDLNDASGAPRFVSLKPGEAGTITARLAPGTYTLVCNLFAGTPESHEALGMKTTLTVR